MAKFNSFSLLLCFLIPIISIAAGNEYDHVPWKQFETIGNFIRKISGYENATEESGRQFILVNDQSNSNTIRPFGDGSLELHWANPIALIVLCFQTLFNLFFPTPAPAATTTTTTTTTTSKLSCADVGGTMCTAALAGSTCFTLMQTTAIAASNIQQTCANTGANMGTVWTGPSPFPDTEAASDALLDTERDLFATCLGLTIPPAASTTTIFGPLPDFNSPNPVCITSFINAAGNQRWNTANNCNSGNTFTFFCAVPW